MSLTTNYSAIVDSPLGKLGIRIDNNYVAEIEYVSNRKPLKKPDDSLSRKVCQQLQSYFKNPEFKFDLPLQTNVSDFQQQVLKALQKIPTGQTKTYGDIAEKLATSPRAVGNACRRNPLPIVIPCHRIVGKNSMGGYSGQTTGSKIAIKEWLLQHEKRIS